MRNLIILLVASVILISGCTQECPQDAKPVCGSNGVTYKNACLAQKANATVVSQGACPATAACTDSDGGKDIFTAGSVTEGGAASDDMCASPDSVLERFCKDSSALSENLPCPSGYQCDGGKCVEVACSDSDGGIKEDVKGSVTAGGKTSGDECADSGSVKEFYCDGGKANSKEIVCASGMSCVNGACVKTLCTDSDGGKDPAIKGTAKAGSVSQTDSCDGNALTEYFCDGDSVKSEKANCPSGYSCTDGKCAKSVCTDSDGGKTADVKGTVSYGTASQTDSCYSNTQVLEYFCASDDSYTSEKMSCGTNRECFDGKCRNVECAVDLQIVDVSDKRVELKAFDDSDELKLYENEVVEINDGMFLMLDTISGNQTSLKLFRTFAKLQDNDDECSTDISAGDTENDLCGRNTGDVEIGSVNDSGGYAFLTLQEYFATQYYSQEGSIKNWTDNVQCQDDEESFDTYTADFYPRLDTASSGLNLDGRKLKLFSLDSRIIEVTGDSVTLDIDGDDVELQESDTFEYRNERYRVTSLEFDDGGLTRMEIELD
ncbi:MAG TPA: Kazal-type serine protease inhibitor family protein [Candidatus Bilamarchaeum sp.]|nr:Kazal-type serine protease inhibitor family protein [Candidatus Bilamarchaeum sp.]